MANSALQKKRHRQVERCARFVRLEAPQARTRSMAGRQKRTTDTDLIERHARHDTDGGEKGKKKGTSSAVSTERSSEQLTPSPGPRKTMLSLWSTGTTAKLDNLGRKGRRFLSRSTNAPDPFPAQNRGLGRMTVVAPSDSSRSSLLRTSAFKSAIHNLGKSRRGTAIWLGTAL